MEALSHYVDSKLDEYDWAFIQALVSKEEFDAGTIYMEQFGAYTEAACVSI